MWFFKIFFQIPMYFIELWLIFCKFRSYERSELQVHRELNLELIDGIFFNFINNLNFITCKFFYLTSWNSARILINFLWSFLSTRQFFLIWLKLKNRNLLSVANKYKNGSLSYCIKWTTCYSWATEFELNILTKIHSPKEIFFFYSFSIQIFIRFSIKNQSSPIQVFLYSDRKKN